ncbi:OmpA family protein [Patiriisocius hiemis]|uniref:OmpA family protein n=1 Tax=Patiriisocius hiemis TaxID=3075604 RepID=A0ABU2Y9N4_9FLAO|nr:OmpA family protein [Constantimarinum sp. W242]MDT0554369.1 OmpA family protein [Constantimarinum sp. W242]
MNKQLKNTFILTLVLLCTSVSFSQKNQIEKANKEFDKYSYIDARETYLKVVENGYESAEILKKLGDTYYWNSDYDNAAKWYQQAIAKFPTEIESEYYYRAAQSLKSVKKYDESDRLMELYSAIAGDSLVIKNFKNDPNYLESIAFESKGYIVEKVSVNTEFSDFGPSYFGDKLVFASASRATEGQKVYSWTDQPFLDLYTADMDAEGKLSNVEPIGGEVNTPYHESSAAFTKDGSTVYFTRNNYTDGKKGKDKTKTVRLKLYKATISGENYWTNIVELPFNSKKHSVAHPALSNDEKRLYFSSDMEGTLGMSDLWYVDITGENSYSEPVNLGPSINTETRESFPFISEENNLYYSTDGRAGLGGFDIYVTPLDANGLPGKITNLGEPANSNQDDFGFIIKEEKRIGYLSSNRDGQNGSIGDDIYRVQEKCEITIVGVVTDVDSGALLPGAEVSLLDANNNEVVEKVIVGDDASYSFTAACESQYLVRGTKEGYRPEEKVVETPDVTGTIEVPLALKWLDPCPPNDLGCRLNLQPIYFDFDRYNIRPDAAIELEKIAAAMRLYPELIIKIESHTDSRGNDAYNEALSDKRAKSTLDYLVNNRGIDRSRFTEATGYGEYQLVNQCSNGVECTEEEHQLNRRSMFLIMN